jgi:putative acetyltransferase
MESIRPELPGDVEAIRRVHESAFPTAVEARLVDALRAAGKLWVSLVADSAERVVGHIAFSPVTLEGAPNERGGVGLAPVAVDPSFQRRGIGGRLIRAGLAACTQAGYRFVVVLGSPAYYGRFGFAPASRWGLRDEYGGGDAFMALELQPGAIPEGAGLVRYAPEFAGLDE